MPIEIHDVLCDGADTSERNLNVAASLLDFFDGPGDEQYPDHVFRDPAGGLWHTAWDLVRVGEIRRECELHDSWDTNVGQPQHDQGIAIMEHDGLPACVSPATATPTS
jgi:hypothetical protein